MGFSDKETYSKANAAYAYGEAEQAITMLNTNLDLNISDYATVNFNALTTMMISVVWIWICPMQRSFI